MIAADLLRLTYWHRTRPENPAETFLNSVQLQVLEAKFSQTPNGGTVAWAVEAIARLGGIWSIVVKLSSVFRCVGEDEPNYMTFLREDNWLTELSGKGQI